MPQLDDDTIRLLDEITVGDWVVVEYRLDGRTLYAKGQYAGQEKNHIGTRCIVVTGVRDSRYRIPMDHVLTIKRA